MIWLKTRYDSDGHDVDVPLMFVVFACLLVCFLLLTTFGHGHVTSHRCHRGYISTNVLNHNGMHLDAQLVQTSYVRIENFYISLPGDGLGTAVPKPWPAWCETWRFPASPPYQLAVSTYPKILE